RSDRAVPRVRPPAARGRRDLYLRHGDRPARGSPCPPPFQQLGYGARAGVDPPSDPATGEQHLDRTRRTGDRRGYRWTTRAGRGARADSRVGDHNVIASCAMSRALWEEKMVPATHNPDPAATVWPART